MKRGDADSTSKKRWVWIDVQNKSFNWAKSEASKATFKTIPLASAVVTINNATLRRGSSFMASPTTIPNNGNGSSTATLRVAPAGSDGKDGVSLEVRVLYYFRLYDYECNR